jgi:ABC-type iron transport system FetAB permease component
MNDNIPFIVCAEGPMVELLFAIGASRMEAMQGIIHRSLHAALMPSLNQLSVIGLVSLPEFLSGQLAFGAAPLQASLMRLYDSVRLDHACEGDMTVAASSNHFANVV